MREPVKNQIYNYLMIIVNIGGSAKMPPKKHTYTNPI